MTALRQRILCGVRNYVELKADTGAHAVFDGRQLHIILPCRSEPLQPVYDVGCRRSDVTSARWREDLREHLHKRLAF